MLADASYRKRPMLAKLEMIAEQITTAGYSCMGDLIDMSAYERARLRKLQSDELDSQAPPAESDPEKSTCYKVVDA